MATFKVGIGKEDIQEPQLMPEDWYTWELVRDAYEDKNSAWKEAEGQSKLSIDQAHEINPKASKNIVLNGRIISDVPEYDGRNFTKWLSLPNKFDEGQWMNNGQPRPDWKAENIYKWAEALQSEIEGDSITFVKGQKCMVYIEQGSDQDGNIVNQISMNTDPKPITDIGLGKLEDEDVLLEDPEGDHSHTGGLL